MTRFEYFRKIVNLDINIKLLCASRTLNEFSKYLYISLFPLYVKLLGTDPIILGIVFMSYRILSPIGFLLSGLLSDRYGRKLMLLSGSFLGVLTYLIYGTATSWLLLIPGIIIESLSSPLYMPSYSAMIAESTTEDIRGSVYGAVAALTTGTAIIAPTMGGIIAETNGYGILFLTCFVLTLISFLILFQISETLRLKEGRTKNAIRVLNPLSYIKQVLSPLRHIKLEFLKTSPLLFTYLCCVSVFKEGLISPFTVLYAQDYLGISTRLFTMAVSGQAVVSLISYIIGGRMADRIGRKKTMMFPILFFKLPIDISFILAPNPYIGMVSLVLAGLLNMSSPAGSAMQAELVSEDIRVRYISLNWALSSLIAIPAPILGGMLWSYVHPSAPFYIAMSLSFGLGLLLISLLPETLRSTSEKD